MQSHAGSAVLDPYRDQAFSLQTYRIQKALGDLHHLLARRPVNIFFFFSDKGLSTIKLIFSKSNYFKVWRHPLKVLDKVAFL